MRFFSSIRSTLFALVLLALSAGAYAQISVSINVAPPELPVYEQPLCPGEGYLWTPGYWAYADDDYYWVPGTWVMAPQVGFLWTPGYWGWGGGVYGFLGRLLGPWSDLWRDLRLGYLGGLRRRTLGSRPVFLQPFGEQCERHYHPQRLQHHRCQSDGDPGQLQRRQWRDQRASEA
jgi:hypothetical protein